MIKDPLTVWDGQYPYDALVAVGITPESSQADIDEVAFTLMATNTMNPTTQKAWHELREVSRRMRADFLLYDVGPAEIDQARERIRRKLADPGEPAEVSAALAVTPEILDGLADELDEVRLEPPPLPAVPADFCAFPTESLLDRLIHFDR